jgi:phage tail-like protein
LLDIPVLAIPPVAFPFKLGQSISELQLLSFKSISIPTMSMETKDIQEGNWPFKHRVPTGFTSSGECTIQGAITSLSMDFYLWFHQAVYGVGAPRRNFSVVHTRQDKLIPRRIILLEGCIPISWKPSSDFDATSSEVSIEELTMAVSRVEVVPGDPL